MIALSRVFDISSQSNLKLRRKWRNRIIKISANLDQIYKHCHGHHDFLCLGTGLYLSPYREGAEDFRLKTVKFS